MEKSKVIAQIKELIQQAKERKFAQTVDLIVNLKGLNIKKQDDKVDFYHILPKGKGKEIRICAFIGGESKELAEKAKVDFLLLDDFKNYSEKKLAVAFADKYDIFIAQANLMGAVATTFGKILGPRGKMPNPKGGCVFPPKANLDPLVLKLRSTIRIITKSQMVCQMPVGNTKMELDDIAENIMSCYTAIEHHLPQEKNNVKNVLIKLTMSQAIKLGD